MLKKIIKFFYRYFKKKIVKNKVRKIIKNIEEKSNNIILVGSPLHGNIGDHAISIAEIKLLKEFKNKNIVEIPGEYYNMFKDEFIKSINKDDIIIITGGGFIGTLWINEENMVRSIISNFKENKIIIMPQTIYFEDSDEGNKELGNSKEIYEDHPNLYFCVRDKKSYDFCKQKLEGVKNLLLIPDIVTYLNYDIPRVKRNGALLCLRKDKEKVILDEDREKLIDILKRKELNIEETTTVINKRISINRRQKIFEDKLFEFKKSKIVITDRLHAMIFSAITATPCIALDNLSGKVKGVYQWLKELEYIKYIDNMNELEENLNKILEIKEQNYDFKHKQEFEKIKDILK